MLYYYDVFVHHLFPHDYMLHIIHYLLHMPHMSINGFKRCSIYPIWTHFYGVQIFSYFPLLLFLFHPTNLTLSIKHLFNRYLTNKPIESWV